MKNSIDKTASAGTSLPGSVCKRKYNKNSFREDFDYSLVLKNALACGMIAGDDVMNSSKEVIMKTILDNIHKHKITPPKKPGGRYVTYVPDETKPTGLRQVRKATPTDMFKYLITFYGLENSVVHDKAFAKLFTEWVEYKRRFIGARNSKKGLSPSTITRYMVDYEKYVQGSDLESLNLSAITSPILEAFFLQIIEKYSMNDQCASNLFGYFNQAFDYARRSKYISENPMEEIDKQLLLSNCYPTETKDDADQILTLEQLASFLEEVKRHKTLHPHYMPDYAAELAVLTGMRVGELAALNESSINDLYISIDYSEHRLDHDRKHREVVIGEPKNKKHRKVPVTNDIRNLLTEIKKARPASDSGFLFVNEKGERYTAAQIGCATKRRFNAIGIKNGSVHRIRRTVSSMLNQVLPQKAVSNLLGHSEKVNEMHYNYSTADTREKIAALNTLSEKILNEKRAETA